MKRRALSKKVENANVVPGDYVILAWRAPCGTCRSCLRGRPWYCFASHNASQPMTLEDGTSLSAALGIGAFSELSLVHAGQAVKIDAEANPAAAGLIGQHHGRPGHQCG